MFFFLTAQILSVLLDFMTIVGRAHHDKDIEILLLRQQPRVLQRKQSYPLRISRWEKLTLVVLARKLIVRTTGTRTRLPHIVFLFKPKTILKWHRELVRRKWTFKQRVVRGRPSIGPDLEALILRLARENRTWGYGKLQGESGALWAKLGYRIGRSTIKDVLKRTRVPPAPQRAQHGTTWGTFLNQYNDQMLAGDCFTVETAWLQTLDVVFCIELGSRRVHLVGCTASPTAAWTTQQARHLRWQTHDGTVPMRFLIHDRDTTFPAAFDAVFTTADVTIIRTPGYPLGEAPNAHAVAERWIRSVREACLDKILILNERHLHRVVMA